VVWACAAGVPAPSSTALCNFLRSVIHGGLGGTPLDRHRAFHGHAANALVNRLRQELAANRVGGLECRFSRGGENSMTRGKELGVVQDAASCMTNETDRRPGVALSALMMATSKVITPGPGCSTGVKFFCRFSFREL
jgi:hypothetical protein